VGSEEGEKVQEPSPGETPMEVTGTAMSPDEVLDRYFDCVTRKDMDGLLTIFAEDAVIVTSSGEYQGHAAIAAFYRNGVFRITRFHPSTGPRHRFENRIALEIELIGDGEVRKVGDFFTMVDGKITRMVVYSGPGYSPTKPSRN
jgi:hypothetical protein